MTRTAGWVAALAALALMRSFLFATLTPPYQASDEPWHLDYARVVGHGRLPVTGRTRIDPAIVGHDKRDAADRGLTLYGITDPPLSREAFQPPLAYVVPGLGYRLLGVHGGLIWFRTFDALLGALLAALAFGAATRAFPGRPFAGPLAGLAAVCLPSIGLIASSSNDDVCAAVLSLTALGLAAGLARRGGPLRQYVALGALVGAAGLTKTTGLAVAVPALVAAAVAPRRGGGTDRSRLPTMAAVLGTAGVVMLPWVVRNLWVYGDLLGTKAFVVSHPGSRIGGLRLLVAGKPALAGAHRFWPELGRSAVGVLRWSDLRLPVWAYVVAALAAAAGVAAVFRWLQTQRLVSAADRRAALVVASALASMVAATAWFAMTVDWQPQGRYLIPGLLGVAGLIGASCGPRGFALAAAVLLALLGAGLVTTASAYGLA